MKTPFLVLLVGVLFGLNSGVFGAERPVSFDERPYLMAGIGDSITAAFVANLPALTPANVPNENLSGPVFGENRDTLSWVTGNKIRSQFVLLQEFLTKFQPGAQLVAANVSISGGVASQIPGQVDQLTTLMDSGKYSKLVYATLLIGGNDVCQGKVVADDIKKNLLSGLEKLDAIGKKQNATIRVLFSSLPRIADLGLNEIRTAHTPLGMTCQQFRNHVWKYCQPLINWADETGYQDAQAYVSAFNQILSEVALTASQQFPWLKIRYTDKFTHTQITVGLMGADCFHPSKAGQEEIAQSLWLPDLWANWTP